MTTMLKCLAYRRLKKVTKEIEKLWEKKNKEGLNEEESFLYSNLMSMRRNLNGVCVFEGLYGYNFQRKGS